MDIFKHLIRILALVKRKKELQNQVDQLGINNFSNDLQKNIITDGVDVTFNSKNKELIENVKNGISALVTKSNADPEKLLEYVKIAKTPVYRIINANKLLKNIKETSGFITEKKGIQALYLSFITFNGLKFYTPAMFILENKQQDKLDILYHFYKWYSMKSGLSGFEYETQEKLKKYYNNPKLLNTNKLKLEEIVLLQEAISRDNEATDFVLDYDKKTSVAKKVSDKIINNNGANL